MPLLFFTVSLLTFSVEGQLFLSSWHTYRNTSIQESGLLVNLWVGIVFGKPASFFGKPASFFGKPASFFTNLHRFFLHICIVLYHSASFFTTSWHHLCNYIVFVRSEFLSLLIAALNIAFISLLKHIPLSNRYIFFFYK